MLYKSLRWIVNIVIKLLFDIRVEGIEQVPFEGPLVICANHISWLDPIVVACIVPRPIHFMAKNELFENKFMAWLLTKLHAFPVKRKKADVGAIRRGLTVLNNGEVIGIFPEGTRQKTPDKLGEAHGGAALLAIKTEACVLPIAIRGKYGFRSTVRIACGRPFVITATTGKLSADVKQGSAQVMKSIKDLWESLIPNEAA